MWRQSFFATLCILHLSPLTGLIQHFKHLLVRLELYKKMCDLLRAFLSNFIKPELLAATAYTMIHEFDYENIANQVSDDEIGIGTATQLLLIENSDELEGTAKERNFFLFVKKFYVECLWKIIAKFPFSLSVI